jgi:hypothetical protein
LGKVSATAMSIARSWFGIFSALSAAESWLARTRRLGLQFDI